MKSSANLRSGRRRFDVVTVGAATRDVFVRSAHFENVPSDSAPDGWNACLPMGAKIPIDELVFETGGGATNAAVTFSRFGFRTACVSRVGKDAGGNEILAQLKAEGVDVRGIQTDPNDRTGYSFILVAGTGSRAILVARGASRHLDGPRIPWKTLPSGWIYLTSVAGNERLLKTIFAHAKKTLTRIAWNPGNAEIDLGMEKLRPFLMQTDVLILNLEEAAALADTTPRNRERLIAVLGELPRTALVVTDGKHGAYAHARGITWHAPALKGRIRNTTGAGDAFGSGFLAGFLKHGDIERALKTATLNAHGVVTHMGAKAGILPSAPGASALSRVNIRILP